jgi:hypothetical protein
MNAYMASVKDQEAEGAMLVFAKTARRARVISHNLDWACCDYLDWVAVRIKNLPTHLMALDDGTEQVITGPPICSICGDWGGHNYAHGCSLCCEPNSFGDFGEADSE